ncbi:acyl-CoA dehydrogenase family protein [Fodinicola acaciae]|uniref:acyl-CoA dehydrogenase family protein n=1 Tax=Fodinicola acaciae TaxID=2681555 RepID=UPI0013D3722F|nr:acyl-CoA dehydrogenase [Fodinicola acaciae]
MSTVDFAFSDEQEALRSTARDWLADRWPVERIVEWIGEKAAEKAADEKNQKKAEKPTPDQAWDELSQLGWLDDDLTVLDLAVIAEEAGYGLLPVQWLMHVSMAAPVLGGRGGKTSTMAWADSGALTLAHAAVSVDCRAEEAGDGWRLSGVKTRVPAANTAQYVVVVAQAEPGVGLFVTRPDARRLRLMSTVDTTRPYAELTLDNTPAEVVVEPGRARPVLTAVRQQTAALLACEGVGVMQRALDMAVSHARQREQFGRPIGSYQGIAYQLADVYTDLQLARSLAYRAAWSVHTGADDTEEAVAAAAACVSEVAPAGCERAIQSMGGIGFTWENPLQRWYKRAQWIASWEGSASQWREELAAWLLDA